MDGGVTVGGVKGDFFSLDAAMLVVRLEER